MKNTVYTILVFIIFAINCSAQKTTNFKLEKVYFVKGDTTRSCYTIIYPTKLPWTDCLFLVPGFGETPERVFEQTDLPQKLAQRGVLTIIPTFQDGVLSLGVDNASQETFERILKDVVGKLKLTDLSIYVGGFSIGGSCAIKYAENAIMKPTAIFAIDPPLDFERYFNSAKRDLRLSKDNSTNLENIYMIDRLEQQTGGRPVTQLKAYLELSPFSFLDTTQAAIKELKNSPLRIYSEPDINWWLKERNADFTSMNTAECSAMINELNRLGNNNATLVITANKGYRKPNNIRHPHSWSIVDCNELIKSLAVSENGII